MMRLNLKSISVIIGLLLLLYIILFILFSTKIANNTLIIKIRRGYYKFVDSSRSVLNISDKNQDNYTYLRTPFRIFSINKSDGEYFYGLIGKLEQVDLEKKQFSVKCSNNQIYVFSANMSEDKYNQNKATVLDIPRQISLETGDVSIYYNRKFSIIWKDKRTMSSILYQHRLDPKKPLNENSIPTLIDIVEILN